MSGSATSCRLSAVRLLDDYASAVAAAVQQSRTPGALAGSTDGTLRLDFVANSAPVAVGDLVVTSPLGGRLPAGLLIGRVETVDGRAEELFQTIKVEPYTDYDRVEQVLVVTSFRPEGQ